MLKATNPSTRRYWNGTAYILIPKSGYTPKSDAERKALLKCMGVVEVGESLPAPPTPKRGRK